MKEENLFFELKLPKILGHEVSIISDVLSLIWYHLNCNVISKWGMPNAIILSLVYIYIYISIPKQPSCKKVRPPRKVRMKIKCGSQEMAIMIG